MEEILTQLCTSGVTGNRTAQKDQDEGDANR